MKLLTCLTLYSIFYQPIITNRRITFYRFRAILKSFIKSAKFSGALYTPVMPRTNYNNENYSARNGRFFAEFKSEFLPVKTPATRHALPFFISGSRKPSASETENASIASPTPISALCAKNVKSIIAPLALPPVFLRQKNMPAYTITFSFISQSIYLTCKADEFIIYRKYIV